MRQVEATRSRDAPARDHNAIWNRGDIIMASSLVSFSNELAALVERSAAPVVAVLGRPRFNSSGVHWSPGVVVTAEHALRYEDEIAVLTGAGDRLPAEVAGRDPGTDLAVLRVKDLAIPVVPKSQDS